MASTGSRLRWFPVILLVVCIPHTCTAERNAQLSFEHPRQSIVHRTAFTLLRVNALSTTLSFVDARAFVRRIRTIWLFRFVVSIGNRADPPLQSLRFSEINHYCLRSTMNGSILNERERERERESPFSKSGVANTRPALTSCAGKTCHARNVLPQNCNISSVLNIFKHNPKGKANNKFITS